MTAPTLEQRIASSLNADAVTSSVLARMISDVEAAIVAAENVAKEERAKALDPTVVVDSKDASVAVLTATLSSERLRAALPRLQERLKQVAAAEYLINWRADFERFRIRRDQLATEFAETYPALVTRIVDLFQRDKALGIELSRMLQARPAGADGYLDGAEATARGSSRTGPPLAEVVRLPDFVHSTVMSWPPPQPHWGLAMMPRPVDPRYLKTREQLAREDSEALARYYKWQEEERKKREATEATARTAAR
jgi:hypothetical protein